MPVHGEYRHQHLHAELAARVRPRDEDIFILENGDVLEIDADGAEIVDKVRAGMVFVDGFEIGDDDGHRAARPAAARRRRHPHRRRDDRRARTATPSLRLSSWRAASCTTTSASRMCSTNAGDRSRRRSCKKLGEVHVTGRRLIQDDIKEKLAELVYARTRRRPLVLPVVVEV